MLGDEGVGVHAARALQREHWSGNVEILEIGTAILDALPALEKADRVIVLDAMKYDGNPGTVYRIPLGKCERSRSIASMHGFDIFRVLALTGREESPEVMAFGVEPYNLDWSMELSPQVTNSMAFLLESVKQEICIQNFEASPIAGSEYRIENRIDPAMFFKKKSFSSKKFRFTDRT